MFKIKEELALKRVENLFIDSWQLIQKYYDGIQNYSITNIYYDNFEFIFMLNSCTKVQILLNKLIQSLNIYVNKAMNFLSSKEFNETKLMLRKSKDLINLKNISISKGKEHFFDLLRKILKNTMSYQLAKIKLAYQYYIYYFTLGSKEYATNLLCKAIDSNLDIVFKFLYLNNKYQTIATSYSIQESDTIITVRSIKMFINNLEDLNKRKKIINIFLDNVNKSLDLNDVEIIFETCVDSNYECQVFCQVLKHYKYLLKFYHISKVLPICIITNRNYKIIATLDLNYSIMKATVKTIHSSIKCDIKLSEIANLILYFIFIYNNSVLLVDNKEKTYIYKAVSRNLDSHQYMKDEEKTEFHKPLSKILSCYCELRKLIFEQPKRIRTLFLDLELTSNNLVIFNINEFIEILRINNFKLSTDNSLGYIYLGKPRKRFIDYFIYSQVCKIKCSPINIMTEDSFPFHKRQYHFNELFRLDVEYEFLSDIFSFYLSYINEHNEIKSQNIDSLATLTNNNLYMSKNRDTLVINEIIRDNCFNTFEDNFITYNKKLLKALDLMTINKLTSIKLQPLEVDKKKMITINNTVKSNKSKNKNTKDCNSNVYTIIEEFKVRQFKVNQQSNFKKSFLKQINTTVKKYHIDNCTNALINYKVSHFNCKTFDDQSMYQKIYPCDKQNSFNQRRYYFAHIFYNKQKYIINTYLYNRRLPRRIGTIDNFDFNSNTKYMYEVLISRNDLMSNITQKVIIEFKQYEISIKFSKSDNFRILHTHQNKINLKLSNTLIDEMNLLKLNNKRKFSTPFPLLVEVLYSKFIKNIFPKEFIKSRKRSNANYSNNFCELFLKSYYCRFFFNCRLLTSFSYINQVKLYDLDSLCKLLNILHHICSLVNTIEKRSLLGSIAGPSLYDLILKQRFNNEYLINLKKLDKSFRLYNINTKNMLANNMKTYQKLFIPNYFYLIDSNHFLLLFQILQTKCGLLYKNSVLPLKNNLVEILIAFKLYKFDENMFYAKISMHYHINKIQPIYNFIEKYNDRLKYDQKKLLSMLICLIDQLIEIKISVIPRKNDYLKLDDSSLPNKDKKFVKEAEEYKKLNFISFLLLQNLDESVRIFLNNDTKLYEAYIDNTILNRKTYKSILQILLMNFHAYNGSHLDESFLKVFGLLEKSEIIFKALKKYPSCKKKIQHTLVFKKYILKYQYIRDLIGFSKYIKSDLRKRFENVQEKNKDPEPFLKPKYKSKIKDQFYNKDRIPKSLMDINLYKRLKDQKYNNEEQPVKLNIKQQQFIHNIDRHISSIRDKIISKCTRVNIDNTKECNVIEKSVIKKSSIIPEHSMVEIKKREQIKAVLNIGFINININENCTDNNNSVYFFDKLKKIIIKRKGLCYYIYLITGNISYKGYINADKINAVSKFKTNRLIFFKKWCKVLLHSKCPINMIKQCHFLFVKTNIFPQENQEAYINNIKNKKGFLYDVKQFKNFSDIITPCYIGARICFYSKTYTISNYIRFPAIIINIEVIGPYQELNPLSFINIMILNELLKNRRILQQSKTIFSSVLKDICDKLTVKLEKIKMRCIFSFEKKSNKFKKSLLFMTEKDYICIIASIFDNAVQLFEFFYSYQKKNLQKLCDTLNVSLLHKISTKFCFIHGYFPGNLIISFDTQNNYYSRLDLQEYYDNHQQYLIKKINFVFVVKRRIIRFYRTYFMVLILLNYFSQTIEVVLIDFCNRTSLLVIKPVCISEIIKLFLEEYNHDENLNQNINIDTISKQYLNKKFNENKRPIYYNFGKSTFDDSTYLCQRYNNSNLYNILSDFDSWLYNNYSKIKDEYFAQKTKKISLLKVFHVSGSNFILISILLKINNYDFNKGVKILNKDIEKTKISFQLSKSLYSDNNNNKIEIKSFTISLKILVNEHPDKHKYLQKRIFSIADVKDICKSYSYKLVK